MAKSEGEAQVENQRVPRRKRRLNKNDKSNSKSSIHALKKGRSFPALTKDTRILVVQFGNNIHDITIPPLSPPPLLTFLFLSQQITMVRDDLPTYFRCPISLGVMKSPVSLCTGVTYDRSSIQRWLDAGNNTCPATMQVLRTTELIPNHTLQRLINIWSHTLPPKSLSQSQSLSQDQASHIVSLLHSHLQNHSLHYSSFISQSLSALTPFASESDDNARFLAPRILPVLLSLTAKVRDLSFLDKLLLFCNVLLRNLAKSDSDALRSRIDVENLDFKSTVLIGLKQGRLELRIAVAKFVELLAKNTCVELNSCSISEDDEFHLELLRLMSTSDAEAVDASLSLLARLAQLKRNTARIVRDGGVAALAAALAGAEMNVASTEKVLKLVEMATGSKEGRNEICGHGNCVRAVVKKVLKVSGAATEHAVTVLWSLCCLYGDKRAAAAVVESNGMAKILVVLQSACSPAVRRMCADLLRVFRCSSKTSCVSWYDTETTHIMPF